MKKRASLIQYFYNEHNIWNWEEKHEANLKLLDKLPNAISKTKNLLLNSIIVSENHIRSQDRDIELEKKIENYIGKENLVPEMLTKKYNVPITTRIVLRDASKKKSRLD